MQRSSSCCSGLGSERLDCRWKVYSHNVFDKTTSNDDNFAEVNPLGYVPVLVLDNAQQDRISETVVLTSYLADQHREANLIPAHGENSINSGCKRWAANHRAARFFV
jgi:glutathione S-transferase